MATTRQASALIQIEEQEQVLLRFGTQFVALKAFENELVARTGTHVFDIANTVVWEAILAKRDLLVIHFALLTIPRSNRSGRPRENRTTARPQSRRTSPQAFPKEHTSNRCRPTSMRLRVLYATREAPERRHARDTTI